MLNKNKCGSEWRLVSPRDVCFRKCLKNENEGNAFCHPTPPIPGISVGCFHGTSKVLLHFWSVNCVGLFLGLEICWSKCLRCTGCQNLIKRCLTLRWKLYTNPCVFMKIPPRNVWISVASGLELVIKSFCLIIFFHLVSQYSLKCIKKIEFIAKQSSGKIRDLFYVYKKLEVKPR